jgi:hypothetical protein
MRKHRPKPQAAQGAGRLHHRSESHGMSRNVQEENKKIGCVCPH